MWPGVLGLACLGSTVATPIPIGFCVSWCSPAVGNRTPLRPRRVIKDVNRREVSELAQLGHRPEDPEGGRKEMMGWTLLLTEEEGRDGQPPRAATRGGGPSQDGRNQHTPRGRAQVRFRSAAAGRPAYSHAGRRTLTHGVAPHPHARGHAAPSRTGSRPSRGGVAHDEEAEASGPSASSCGRRPPPARAGRGSAPGAPRTPGRPVLLVPDLEEDGRAALRADDFSRLRPAVRTKHFRPRSASQAVGAYCPAGRALG